MKTTNKEQSERLLACGIPADTADEMIRIETIVTEINRSSASLIPSPIVNEKRIPAWSLSALLELLPKEIHDENGDSYYFSLAKEFLLSEEYGVAYIPCWDNGDAIIRKRDNCPIEACVQMIEELYKRELI